MSSADQSTPGPAPQKKGWFGRNWKWLVPTVVLLPILACGGCGLGMFYFGINAIKNMEPYKDALTRVQSDATVIERLGEPVEDVTTVPSWNINVEPGGGGNADGYFTVAGPNGEAKVRVKARSTGGSWDLIELEVTFADNERIDLLRGAGGRDADLDSAPPFDPGGAAPDTP